MCVGEDLYMASTRGNRCPHAVLQRGWAATVCNPVGPVSHTNKSAANISTVQHSMVHRWHNSGRDETPCVQCSLRSSNDSKECCCSLRPSGGNEEVVSPWQDTQICIRAKRGYAAKMATDQVRMCEWEVSNPPLAYGPGFVASHWKQHSEGNIS